MMATILRYFTKGLKALSTFELQKWKLYQILRYDYLGHFSDQQFHERCSMIMKLALSLFLIHSGIFLPLHGKSLFFSISNQTVYLKSAVEKKMEGFIAQNKLENEWQYVIYLIQRRRVLQLCVLSGASEAEIKLQVDGTDMGFIEQAFTAGEFDLIIDLLNLRTDQQLDRYPAG